MATGAQLGAQSGRELCNPQGKTLCLNFLVLKAFYLAMGSLLPWHQRRIRKLTQLHKGSLERWWYRTSTA